MKALNLFLATAIYVGLFSGALMSCSATQQPFDLTRAVHSDEAKVPFELVQTPSEPTPDEFAPSTPNEDEMIPEPLPGAVTEHGFRNTFYYLIVESDYADQPKTEAVLDRKGQTLALVSKQFRKDLLMEGSGKLLDGRVLNYAGRVGEEARFHVTEHSWGRGAGNCPLKPFKSIAVDSSQIPLGSVIYIDETKGMLLPDGSRHNGVWYAEDTGGAILHDRIDIYIGYRKDRNFLARGGVTHMKPLTVRVLRQPDGESCAYQSPR